MEYSLAICNTIHGEILANHTGISYWRGKNWQISYVQSVHMPMRFWYRIAGYFRGGKFSRIVLV